MKKCKHKFESDGGPCIYCKLTHIELNTVHLIDVGDQIEKCTRRYSENELRIFTESIMNNKQEVLNMGDVVEVNITSGINTPHWEHRIFLKYGRDESAICVNTTRDNEERYHNGDCFEIVKWDKDCWRKAKKGIIKFWEWIEKQGYGNEHFEKNDNAYYAYKDMPKQMLIGYMLEYIMETKETIPGISRIQSINEYYDTLVGAL